MEGNIFLLDSVFSGFFFSRLRTLRANKSLMKAGTRRLHGRSSIESSVGVILGFGGEQQICIRTASKRRDAWYIESKGRMDVYEFN